MNTVPTVRERAGFRGGAGKRGVGTRGGRQRPGQSAVSSYALDVTPCCVVSTRELSMRIVAEECIAVGSSVETALPPAMVRPHKTPLSSMSHVLLNYYRPLTSNSFPPSPLSIVVTHSVTKCSVF